MHDFRPVGFFIGILVVGLGLSMILPLLADLAYRNGHWSAFAISGAVTIATGAAMAFACFNGLGDGLNIPQTFLLTSGVFVVIPVFAAIPFILGAPDASFVDAFFEAMSGLTTTGATVFTNLESMPEGVLLWRGMLQWLGAVWMIVVAIVMFPLLRVGGMQLFRWDSYDTMGTIQARAVEATRSVSVVYVVLTALCALCYMSAGQSFFDSVVHSMTTVATGGFANYDSSFGEVGAWSEYVCVLFMILASLPFIRYVQAMRGSMKPILKDSQIHGFLLTIAVVFAVLGYWQYANAGGETELIVRKVLFNSVSILTGTGYVSTDYSLWGSFPVVLFFLLGFVGGCAGSTSCSIKVFRFQLLIGAVVARFQRITNPHAVTTVKYGGHQVRQEVLASVMAFFFAFIGTLVAVSILLALTGLDFITSVSGAAASLANIGPGLGSQIGPSGSYAEISDFAKWVLSATMMVGRLELMTVYVLFSASFWRA